MDYEKFCSDIFELAPQVRFVGIYNKSCKKLGGGMRPRMVSYLSQKETEDSISEEMKRWKSYKLFYNKLGNAQYSMVKYDKATLITISLDENELLLVSLEPVADHYRIMDHILYLLNHN